MMLTGEDGSKEVLDVFVYVGRYLRSKWQQTTGHRVHCAPNLRQEKHDCKFVQYYVYSANIHTFFSASYLQPELIKVAFLPEVCSMMFHGTIVPVGVHGL